MSITEDANRLTAGAIAMPGMRQCDAHAGVCVNGERWRCVGLVRLNKKGTPRTLRA